MKHIQTNDHLHPSRIIGIQFGISSAAEIINNSVVEIVSKTITNDNLVVGGLFDAKMGVLKQGTYCPTDGHTYINCPGYFGHLMLAKPVFYIQFIKDVIKVAKGHCLKCGRSYTDKTLNAYIAKLPAADRWDKCGQSKSKRCGDKGGGGCGARRPTSIKVDGFATIIATWKPEKDEPADPPVELTPEFLYKLFQQISDDDVNFMGLSSIWSRPENMICVVLPIAPPAVRPSVEQDANQRSEDDMTHIYMNILKNNSILQQKIQENAPATIIHKHHQIIQYFVAMIANNKASGASPIAQASGRPLQCVRDRLDSKGGRIRSNLMGKRVDFSARSVITGDPNLAITELGIPKKIAMNLTKPTAVNARNHAFLLKLVQNGPDEYPGAKCIDCVGGDKINLRAVDRMSIQLQFGDVVHRHLLDGDAVLFNRQPSLHKMSMMCHRARIMSTGNTFRFNVAVTNPYNADFDGDEMNMHVPQSITADVELQHLPVVTQQIISPSKNAPIIGIFQDNMLGSYIFTKPGLSFTVPQAMKLLAMFPHIDVALFEGKTKITNYEILTQIMPAITLKLKNAFGTVDIRNGVWIDGQVDKSVFGAATKGILQRICNDFGNEACVAFINDLQNIITEFMKTNSYSVGISDLMATPEAKSKIAHLVIDGKQGVIALLNKVRLGLFENTGAYSNAVEFETQVSNILADARSKMEKIGHDSLRPDNRFLQIVASGAKGSPINISQMISCLGQQSIEGKRAPYGFDNRTLPHFNKYDDSAAARGFVDSSYIQGLGPHEMFFHAMAGRIGLIDTAVKTSQTGYIQRRLVKAMENIVILYDGTARNHMGKIVQFVYGDDGFCSTKVETQSLPLVSMSVEDIYMKYDLVAVNINESSAQLLAMFTQAAKTRIAHQRVETKKKCQEYIDKMILWRDEVVANVFGGKNDDRVRLPVSFTHIIENLYNQLDLVNRVSDITPLEAFELIEEYHQKILDYSIYIAENRLFEVLYFYYLSPKELILDKRFGRQTLTLLLETILLRVKQAFVHPGEMVGVIAAQSIGEPTTQLTLNTFHSAGVASKANVTRGVPRIDEILRLTENPKNPSLTITPFGYDEHDQSRAMNYANLIECTLLRNIVRSVQIIYDPSDDNTVVDDDVLLLNQYKAFCEQFGVKEQVDPAQVSAWIIRMEFDPREMLEKNITMDDVNLAITSMYGSTWGMTDDDDGETGAGGMGGDNKAKRGVNGSVQCIYSDFNDTKLIFRVRVGAFIDTKSRGKRAGLDLSDEINYLKIAQDNMLNKVVLRGVNGITKVIPRKLQNMTTLVDGKHVQKDAWVLDTTGTNMLDVLGLPFIDFRRTMNNDIREVLEVLGIEAARQVILNEFIEVMDFNGVYIDYHHMSLTADRMSYSKNLVAVFRNGINKDNIGPISKSSFEMHTEMFLHAAKHGELDNMRGVSANVMCGQHGNYGTHAFQVHLDLVDFEKKNAANMAVSKAFREKGASSLLPTTNVYDVEKTIETMFGNALLAIAGGPAINTACAADNISIPNYLSEMTVTNNSTCVNDGYDLGF
jgi:DNA-directed RNA polymerase II subunit RPB1